MMKRTGVPRLGPDEPPQMPSQIPVSMQQQSVNAGNIHAMNQSAQPQLISATAMLSVSGTVGGFRSRPPTPAVINYIKPSPVQYTTKAPLQMAPRHKVPYHPQPVASPGPVSSVGSVSVVPPSTPPPGQFQRLKVEDALSYLDQVKYKFNTQPQVYNDFLDIMKEFKSQTIDTPGVITRVSTLFKGHPELIVGFNTFLPPGYKIEVQSNGQVSVSMPSPTALGAGGVLLHHPQPQPQLVQLLPVSQPVNIVHNLSVNPSPTNTLHHISQAHQQIEAAAIQQHHAGVQTTGPGHQPVVPPGQPVEFNHAIEYVNKIKSRFSRQPDKYKKFLEILHAYQRGHRESKPQAKQQTEQEVYSQVAKLFENQEDLLAEFGQFLPDAKAVAPKHINQPMAPHTPPLANLESEVVSFNAAPPPASPPHNMHVNTQTPVAKHVNPIQSNVTSQPQPHLKRSPSFTSSSQMACSGPPPKKLRPSYLSSSIVRDVSFAEAAKYGAMQEYNYFDKVRKALRNQDVYDNFLRCLLLYTNEIVSSSELICVVAPFLVKHPELLRWLTHFVSPPNGAHENDAHLSHRGQIEECSPPPVQSPLPVRFEPLSSSAAQIRLDRPQGDAAMDIDLSTCKRLGTSYCALPRGSAEAASRKCSGRTTLCKEVLNDTWVSFPTWSEDSTFVTSRKTQYEEYIYRCEDERFELDVVLESNAMCIRALEGVSRRISRLAAEEASRVRLDEALGGASAALMHRALKRIYGDKAVDIIAGLRKNPVVAVPVVLRRLKAKEEEWREAQKGFNKQWREQNEKYYLKSLDHQGINFKQHDLKALRSKSLFNEIESAYAARKQGPHVFLNYHVNNRQEAIKIVRDASELLIHHARRQTAIQKAEKRRIKQVLRQFIPDLFNHPRIPLSDDERDDDEKEEPASPSSGHEDANNQDEKDSIKQEKEPSSESDNGSDKSIKNNKNNKENTPKNNNTDVKETPNNSIKRSNSNDPVKNELKPEAEIEDDYRDHPANESRFVCTSSWYLFLRLHCVVCERLSHVRHAASRLSSSESRSPSATALRLRPNNLPPDVSSPSEYYNAILELIRNVLDGNMEPSAYEDATREMLGILAYPAYTLDKLVSNCVRQLQHCVSESCGRLALSLASTGRNCGYVRRAKSALAPHAAFLFMLSSGQEVRGTFELLQPAHTSGDQTQISKQNATTIGDDQPPIEWPTRNKCVFLRRNARMAPTGSHNRALCPGIEPGNTHARRKPHHATIRLLSARAQHFYRKGSLRNSRESHARLHSARRARFKAWLRQKDHG